MSKPPLSLPSMSWPRRLSNGAVVAHSSKPLVLATGTMAESVATARQLGAPLAVGAVLGRVTG